RKRPCPRTAAAGQAHVLLRLRLRRRGSADPRLPGSPGRPRRAGLGGPAGGTPAASVRRPLPGPTRRDTPRPTRSRARRRPPGHPPAGTRSRALPPPAGRPRGPAPHGPRPHPPATPPHRPPAPSAAATCRDTPGPPAARAPCRDLPGLPPAPPLTGPGLTRRGHPHTVPRSRAPPLPEPPQQPPDHPRLGRGDIGVQGAQATVLLIGQARPRRPQPHGHAAD